jgi:organic radical activating enzyme
MSIDPRGAILPCCRYMGTMSFLKDERIDLAWNNKNYKDLRTRFLNNEKPKECVDCWNAEDAGDESLRQVINGWSQDIEFDSNIVETPPIYYEFKTTNVCNLKCRMCGSFNSSSIAKETETLEVRNHFLSDKLINSHHEEIIYKWLKTTKYILFAGGEPFVNTEIKTIIEHIETNDLSKDIEVLMVTNGTHWNDKFVSQLKQIKNFNLRISLDDVGKRNDYQRERSSFDIIEVNFIKFLIAFPKKVMFNCTINWYNIWEIEELFEYADDWLTPVSVQFVTHPPYLNIINLPLKTKTRINKKYKSSNDPRIKAILSRLNLPGKDLSNKFFTFNDHYDKLRNNNFKEVFPEWSRIIKDDAM